jgi:hypothetical protein
VRIFIFPVLRLRAAPLFAIRPEPLDASSHPLLRVGAGPFGRIYEAPWAKQENHDAAVQLIRPVAFAVRSTCLKILVLRLREHQHRIEFATALKVALTVRVAAPRQEILFRVELQFIAA